MSPDSLSMSGREYGIESEIAQNEELSEYDRSE